MLTNTSYTNPNYNLPITCISCLKNQGSVDNNPFIYVCFEPRINQNIWVCSNNCLNKLYNFSNANSNFNNLQSSNPVTNNTVYIPQNQNKLQPKTKKNKRKNRYSPFSKKNKTNKAQEKKIDPSAQEKIVVVEEDKIDVPVEDVAINCWLIVDTNCWILNLEELLRLGKHHKNIQIVIPIVVISELDGLKKSEDKALASKATNVLRTLNAILANPKEELIKTQEINEKDESIPVYNNDDKILSCSSFYKKEYSCSTNSKTVLLTSDNGLQIKARIYSILCSSTSDFLKTLPATAFTDQQKQRGLINSQNTQTNSRSEEGLVTIEPKTKSVVGTISNDSMIAAGSKTLCTNNISEIPVRFIFSEHIYIWNFIFSFLSPSALRIVACSNTQFWNEINYNNQLWLDCIQNTFKDSAKLLVKKNQNAKKWYLNWRSSCLTKNHP